MIMCEGCGAVDVPWAVSWYTGRQLCDDCIDKEAADVRAIKIKYKGQKMYGWCRKAGPCSKVDICPYYETHGDSCKRSCEDKNRCVNCKWFKMQRDFAN